MRQLLRVAGYRFRATLASRWGGLLSLVVLIGLVGGLSMGALAGARRTDSSFPVYLQSTNPSTLQVFAGFADPQLGLAHGYAPKVIHALATLPRCRARGDIDRLRRLDRPLIDQRRPPSTPSAGRDAADVHRRPRAASTSPRTASRSPRGGSSIRAAPTKP